MFENYKFYPNGKGREICFIRKKNTNYIIRNTIEVDEPYQYFDEYIENLGDFNCGFIEKYEPCYNTMKHHSDCSLDIDPESNIGIISFYEDINKFRTLELKCKLTQTIETISLKHEKLILISYQKNQEYTHRIVGKERWVGITLYKSKTNTQFSKFTEEQKKNFYLMRKMENKFANYKIDFFKFNFKNKMDCIEDDVDYLEKKNLEMKPKYESNIKKLFDDFCLKTRRQLEEGYDRNDLFYISQLNFTNGEETRDGFGDMLSDIFNKLVELSEKKKQQNLITIEKMEKLGKPIPDVVKNFVDISNITVMLHTYGIKKCFYFVSSHKADFETYICDNFNQQESNPSIQSDNMHRIAHQYFIKKGILKRDTEEEMIFGDELL